MPKLKYIYPITIPSNMPDGIASGVKKTLHQISEVSETFSDKFSEINTSNDLTSSGKQNASKEIGNDVVKALAEVEKDIAGYDTNISNIEKDLLPPKSAEETVLSYLKEKELRDKISDLDPLERETIYRNAITDNSTDVIAAIENAPALFPVVSASLIEKLKDERLAALFPDQFEKISTLQTAKGLVTGAIVAVKSSLEKEGIQFPVDDPVKKAAQGEN